MGPSKVFIRANPKCVQLPLKGIYRGLLNSVYRASPKCYYYSGSSNVSMGTPPKRLRGPSKVSTAAPQTYL